MSGGGGKKYEISLSSKVVVHKFLVQSSYYLKSGITY